jgi:hypothetical protein
MPIAIIERPAAELPEFGLEPRNSRFAHIGPGRESIAVTTHQFGNVDRNRLLTPLAFDRLEIDEE